MSEAKGNIGPGLGEGWAQGAGDAGWPRWGRVSLDCVAWLVE